MSVKSGNKQNNRNNVALSTLAMALLAAYAAPAAHAGNIDWGSDVTYTTSGTGTLDQITVSDSDFAVGTATLTTSSAAAAGIPAVTLPSDTTAGYTYVYTVTGEDGTITSTSGTTGSVLLEQNGDITGSGGSTTTTVETFDEATLVTICSMTGGCGTVAFGDVVSTTTGIAGTYVTAGGGNFLAGTTQTTTTTVAGAGGNLTMSGDGSFGGDLSVDGTVLSTGINNTGVLVNTGPTTLNGATTVNNMLNVDTNGAAADVNGTTSLLSVENGAVSLGVLNAAGELNGISATNSATTIRGGTGTTTQVWDDNGTTVTDSVNGTTFSVSNTGNAYILGNLDMSNGNINNVNNMTNSVGSGVYNSGYTTQLYADGSSVYLDSYNADVTNYYGAGLDTNGYSATLNSNDGGLAYVDNYYAYLQNGYGSYTGAYGSSVISSAGGTSLTVDSSGVTLSGNESNGTARLTGVANGKGKYDAVNVGQFKGLEDTLSGGIASTIAMTNIPHVDEKKTFALGVGLGNYNGEYGYAVGGSYRFMGSGVLKASVGGSSSGDTAWGVGGGMSW